MRGGEWQRESSLPKKAGRQADPRLPPPSHCSLTQHSRLATLSLVAMTTSGQDAFPKARPICPPSGELFFTEGGKP